MVISTIRMKIPVKKHNDVLRIIRSIAVLSRDDPGCFSFHIYNDLEDKSVLMLQENWKTEEDIERHVGSEEYRNLLLVLEMSLKPPEIRFDIISESTGIENIERIRGAINRG